MKLRRSSRAAASDGAESEWAEPEPELEPEPQPAPQAVTPDPEADLKPSAMRGTEPMYGYLVLAELVAVSILNLAITHGAGAPHHSQTIKSVIGLAAALIYGATIPTRNRFIVGFSAIISTFVITSLPAVPNSVKLYHLFALVIALVYAVLLTQRQRKAAMIQIRTGKAPPAKSAADRRAEAIARRQERRRGRGQPVPTGPAANRRYTPPKAKRRRP